MAPKGKGKAKGFSFKWDDETTKMLLTICLDHLKTYGVDEPFSWVKISEELGKKIGKTCCCVSVKNKFGHMKKRWFLWVEFWQNEPSVTRNANDARWWNRKIQENKEYKQFRKNGMAAEIDDLCTLIFDTIAATSEHRVAPSRDSLEGDGGETGCQSQPQADEIKSESQSPSEADGIKAEPQSQIEADGIKSVPQSEVEADAVSDDFLDKIRVRRSLASKPKASTQSVFKKSNKEYKQFRKNGMASKPKASTQSENA